MTQGVDETSDSGAPHVDVLVVGGGPAGLSAALVLGRARKQVLLLDAGTPRNAAATHIHGFVTRDGTPPAEFRRIAQQQLTPYASVTTRREQVVAVRGRKGRFTVTTQSGSVQASRVLLCLGLIDELPELPGYRELWGRSIFQCPYCHGWEVRDRAFGFLAPTPQLLEWSLFLTGWTRDLVVFTDGKFAAPADSVQRLAQASIRVEQRPIRRLQHAGSAGAAGEGGAQLVAVELTDGTAVPREVLFARPPQRQQALVGSLGLALDEQGFVRVDDQLETSVPGIYAAGDLTTLFQGALLAAAAGAQAAYRLNHTLTMERAGAPAGH